jgi:hypothetical protein
MLAVHYFYLSPYRRNRWAVIATRENPPKSPCFH